MLRAKSVIAVVVVMIFTISSALADCNPRGFTPVGPQTWQYDYLANNVFEANCAWSYLNSVRKTDGAMGCTINNYAQFNHPNPNPGYFVCQLYQTFYVPRSGEPGFISNSTSWGVGFQVHVVDPLASANNLLYVTVIDNDTLETLAFGPSCGAPTVRASVAASCSTLPGTSTEGTYKFSFCPLSTVRAPTST